MTYPRTDLDPGTDPGDTHGVAELADDYGPAENPAMPAIGTESPPNGTRAPAEGKGLGMGVEALRTAHSRWREAHRPMPVDAEDSFASDSFASDDGDDDRPAPPIFDHWSELHPWENLSGDVRREWWALQAEVTMLALGAGANL